MTDAKRPITGKATKEHAGWAEECGGKTKHGADARTDENFAAVEQLQQAHADEAAGREQSPEPRDGGCTGGVRIVAVVNGQKFRSPVSGALF